ncbi:transcription elongation factor B polypeptide 3-like isoform X1 [Galleria mellonella]|uniref:Transcription elongation factor B polypeptide 3-like isoform X1 n=1 Tax=Galleria mellonella TaxID=7137 RepID=A0ABM3N145_GALME|nr:transcription elongation factor B polypeptide 3-like isoform X1 [Galleria mellonella]XP_052757323.1 transcription elongation factor B polypeptide 3-like isoform X1 [Galleria mellonella]
MVAAEECKSGEYQREKHNYNYKNDGQKYNKKVNGNYSGTKRKYRSSEDEEHDIKKKRSSASNGDYYNGKCDVKIKSEPKSDSDLNREHSNGDETDFKISQLSEEEVKLKPSSKRSHDKCTHDKKECTSKKSRNSDKDSKRSNENKNKHDAQKSSPQEKSHTAHKHSNTHESSSATTAKHKLDHSSLEKKQTDEKKSSTRHHSSSEKHRSSSQSADSGSDKHRSSSRSHRSDKEKHKSLSERENSIKHKIKESNSSSSKEKHSSSSKEKSRDGSSSSKENSDSKSGKLWNESRSKRGDNKSKHEKHKCSSSSSSHRSSESSSSPSEEDVPKKTNHVNNSEDGIDCSSGASFAEALGMLSSAKPKKKSPTVKETQSPNSITNDVGPAALLAPNAKLAPLSAFEISALSKISPNYKPRPPPKPLSHFTDEEAMSAIISSKNQRTKVYSGNKVMGKVPTLYVMCVHLLQEHIDGLKYTGGVPYELLKPVVDKATPQQLFVLEHFNPYLMEDTAQLWQKYCEKHFRKQQRHEMETWREMYIRCQKEQEHKLKNLTVNIKKAQEAKKAPVKQTKMVYCDTVVKAPRNMARAAAASPAARVAALATPLTIRAGSGRASSSASPSPAFKPKKAPLMQKVLKLMRGRTRS